MSNKREFQFYIVPTPIGNLKDITLRAIEVLQNVDIIACEDSRVTQKLLNHYEIKTKCISYHKYNEKERVDYILNIINEGKKVALVSDAGTPMICDPGSVLLKELIDKNITVTALAGACAVPTFLSQIPRDSEEFTFIGFLPLNKKNRKEKLNKIKTCTNTAILYEAPHKILSTLKDLNEFLENRKIVLARELTKIHEEFIFGTANELLKKLENPKGEFVIIIEKCNNSELNNIDFLNNLSLEDHYNFYLKHGLEKNEIIKKIAKDKNVPKNEIYKKFI